MTHFLAAVIVPAEEFENRTDTEIEETISEYMAPYAEEAAEIYMEKTVELDKHECMKEAASYILRSGDDGARRLFQSGLYAHILKATGEYYGIINSEGCLCYLSNPNSFYDWYRVGGRYDGVFTGKTEDDGKGGFNFEKNFETIENNHVPIKGALHAMEGALERNKYYREAARAIRSGIAPHDEVRETGWHPGFGWFHLMKDFGMTTEQYWKINDAIAGSIAEFDWDVPFLVYTLVTPDDWYNGKGYGWFGTSNNTMDADEWEKEYVEVLKKYKDDYLVFLDCHV